MEVHEIIDMSRWKTLDTIVTELHVKGITISRRTLRIEFVKQNERFCQHETNVYTVHGCKGYKIAQSTAEIIMSANDLFTRAVDMYKKYYKVKKAIREKHNLTLDLEKIKVDTGMSTKKIKTTFSIKVFRRNVKVEFEFEKSELQKVERLIEYLKSAGIKAARRTEIVTSVSGRTSTKHKFIILVEEEYEETTSAK